MIQYIPTSKQPANSVFFTPLPLNPLPSINKEWTLFLDRDGVINEEVIGDYIKRWEDFHFRPGSLEAIAKLTPLFKHIIVTSNQAGVGKGLMTLGELNFITEKMVNEIETNDGRITKTYYCTATDNNDINRKPNPGMALQAKNDFPDIELSKTIMVGNMPNDMLFGKKFGAFTVYLPTREDEKPEPSTVNAVYKDLLAFANDLCKQS